MFYCTRCAKRREWPESIFQSHGRCEVCGKVASCSDTPSKYLPASRAESPIRRDR